MIHPREWIHYVRWLIRRAVAKVRARKFYV